MEMEQTREIRLVVLDGDYNKAVLRAMRQSHIYRMKGTPVQVVLVDGKKPFLTITPQGDIEELMPSPLRVGMVDRVADSCMVTNNTTRRNNALSFARLVMSQGGIS